MSNPNPLGGSEDTPFFPNTTWRVHGNTRPQPPVVTPPAPSTQERPGTPPSDAIVLYDGSESSLHANWEMDTAEGGQVAWTIGPDYIEVPGVHPAVGNIRTRQHFGDGQYHVEWASPTEIKGQSQGRGNSGVFLLGIYEIQVLDNYENPTYADGTVGGVYGQIPPLVNAIRPPGQWNTYDIAWVSPRFDGDRLISPGRLTLVFNGIFVHHAVEVMGPTQYRKLPSYSPHPPAGPLVLQDHWDKVRFRNIWYRPLGQYDGGAAESPVRSALVRE